MKQGIACRGVLHTPPENTPHKNTNDGGVCGGGRGVCGGGRGGVCNTPLRSPSQTLGAIVRGFKSIVSKQAGFSVWQRNYHEHIIRNFNAYENIADYIENNPIHWETDCFYK
jgi:hypothetical protein